VEGFPFSFPAALRRRVAACGERVFSTFAIIFHRKGAKPLEFVTLARQEGAKRWQKYCTVF